MNMDLWYISCVLAPTSSPNLVGGIKLGPLKGKHIHWKKVWTNDGYYRTGNTIHNINPWEVISDKMKPSRCLGDGSLLFNRRCPALYQSILFVHKAGNTIHFNWFFYWKHFHSINFDQVLLPPLSSPRSCPPTQLQFFPSPLSRIKKDQEKAKEIPQIKTKNSKIK